MVNRRPSDKPAGFSHVSRAAAIFLALTLVASNAAPLPVPAGPPRVFLIEASQLLARQSLRRGDKHLQPALEQLQRDAAKALRTGPFSVTTKAGTPPSGDKHDYMSQAPYYWRNPNTSNGLPYVHRDGERNPELKNFSDHKSLDELENSTETLGLAYYFTGDEQFAAHSAELLRAWFIEPATRMNPNLEFGQAVPGITTGRGNGLIETRGLTRVVDAVGLLAGSQAWTDADQRGVEKWYSQFLKWMRESKIGREEGAAKNNHGTYYDIQTASFALFLGQRDLATEILSTSKSKRFARQIEPDGRQPLELVRTKSWSYSVANLSGLESLAELGGNVGVDLWDYRTADGRGIGAALDYLVPFALEHKPWPDQQIGEFNRESLYPLIRLAAIRCPKSHFPEIAAKLPPVASTNRFNLLEAGAVAAAKAPTK